MSSGDPRKAILIHFSGHDHPGLTAQLTRTLAIRQQSRPVRLSDGRNMQSACGYPSNDIYALTLDQTSLIRACG